MDYTFSTAGALIGLGISIFLIIRKFIRHTVSLPALLSADLSAAEILYRQ